jgi:hypothetical protein
VNFEETASPVYPLRSALALPDTYVQGHSRPHLAQLSATKLCEKEHCTISSQRHIKHINNIYLQDFGGIDPGKSACGKESLEGWQPSLRKGRSKSSGVNC